MCANYEKLIRLADTISMREMDSHAIENLGIDGLVLMENAARSVADWLTENKLKNDPESRVVVCCGKGNNGGDGFAIARLLANRGYNIHVVDAGEAKETDSRKNQLLWNKFGESTPYTEVNASRLIKEADVLVDAIFGIGIKRSIDGTYREWIENFNSNKTALTIAVDIPSGVSTDDSHILGIATNCQHTITFQKGKPGCYQFPGTIYAGKVHIVDISIPEEWPEKSLQNEKNLEPLLSISKYHTYLLTPDFISELIPKRSPNAHKGSSGHLITVCGSSGMGGAASLSSIAALKIGAGLVSACVPESLRDNLPGIAPEVMTVSPNNSPNFFLVEHTKFVKKLASLKDALLIGCGLGVHSETKVFVQNLIKELRVPLLIDADGLNNIDEFALKSRKRITIITPHPLELSRLCGQSVSDIQENRISTVRRLAQEWNVILLLKGPYTVIGCPSGKIFINPTGNSALATAGSGDVLSGFISGLLAQGVSALNSTLIGSFMHGLAADCFIQKTNSNNMVASDIFNGLIMAMSELNSLKY